MSMVRPSRGAAIFPNESGYVASIHAQFEEINDNLNAIIKSLKNVSAYILLDALIPTYSLSQKFVPVRTGALALSGYLEIVENDDRGCRVELGYGKHGQPFYAIIVHERIDIPHRPPTRSKYLQAAISQDMRNIQARVEEHFKDVME